MKQNNAFNTFILSDSEEQAKPETAIAENKIKTTQMFYGVV